MGADDHTQQAPLGAVDAQMKVSHEELSSCLEHLGGSTVQKNMHCLTCAVAQRTAQQKQAEDDLYMRLKRAQRQLEMLGIQVCAGRSVTQRGARTYINRG